MASSDSWTPDPVNLPPWALDPACLRVERYLLGPEIGRGGMGRVHFAWDPMLRRLLALKLLHGDDPEQHLRLLREARNQAKLDHPNICRIHDLGMEGTRPYIAMQLILGNPLSDLRPYLDFNGIASLMSEVASGIHAAHLAGLIHRDLKPANILVTGRGTGKLVPFVVDFGLARDLQSQDQTLSWSVMGTPAFMSPEQARGEALGPATDIYSLGATLYAMLSGHPPYEGCTLGGLISQQADQGVMAVRRLNRDTPKDLETITLKCLESEPSRRYTSALALEQDLRRWLAGEPIQARHVGPAGKLWRWSRRKPTLAATAAAGLLSVAVLGGWNIHTVRASRLREQAAQHFGQEAERIEALVRYARLSPEQNIEPLLAAARQRLSKLETEAGSGGQTSGPLAYALGRSLLAFGEVDQALPRLQLALDSGMRSQDLSYALGRAYGMVYQKELERTRSLESPELRAARRKEIERQWRDPALAQLRHAKGLSLEPAEYLEALVDSFGGRTEPALDKVRVAIAKAPWFYEGHRLEGELLLALAHEDPDVSRSRLHLDAASAAFAEARRTAPSDSSLWLGEVRVGREYFRLFPRESQAGACLAKCREAVQACLRIRPSDPRPLIHLAGALMSLGREGNPRTRDRADLLKESLSLATLGLERSPDSIEAHQTHLEVLVALAMWKSEQGGDPTEGFARAVAAAQASLERFPGDPALLQQGSLSAQTQMSYLGYTGRNPEPLFKQALEWAQELQRRFPELGSSHFKIASLRAEEAEHLRLHGQDPRPALNLAEAALEEAWKAPVAPLARRAYSHTLGDQRLIRGQYALAVGEDSTQALDGAIAAYRNCAELGPDQPKGFSSLGEAGLFRAMAAFAVPSEAEGWLDVAEKALARSLALGERYFPRMLMGQAAWVRARLALVRGEDASRAFRTSLQHLKRAVDSDPTATSYCWTARVFLDRGGSPFSQPEDLSQGLAAAEAALIKNAHSGEARLLKGQLLRLRAEQAPGRQKESLRRDAESEIQEALRLNPSLRRRAEDPHVI